MKLNNAERETIITFDEENDDASIFTYSRKWITHLEKVLGLKPTNKDDFGGRDYVIPKKWIKLPRRTRRLSTEEKEKRVKALAKNRLRGR